MKRKPASAKESCLHHSESCIIWHVQIIAQAKKTGVILANSKEKMISSLTKIGLIMMMNKERHNMSHVL